MTYADPMWCPTCGTAIPAHTVKHARAECRRCQNQVDVTEAAG